MITISKYTIGQSGGGGGSTYETPVDLGISPTTGANDYIALLQSLGGADVMVLQNTSTTLPRRVTLTSANDMDAVTFTIVGNSGTENISGPNNETVQTTNFYTSITSITTDAAITDVSAGSGEAQLSLDISSDSIVLFEPQDDVKISASGFSNMNSCLFVITNGGLVAIDWGSVNWPYGSIPTLSDTGRDVIILTSYDGGTTIDGMLSGFQRLT